MIKLSAPAKSGPSKVFAAIGVCLLATTCLQLLLVECKPTIRVIAAREPIIAAPSEVNQYSPVENPQQHQQQQQQAQQIHYVYQNQASQESPVVQYVQQVESPQYVQMHPQQQVQYVPEAPQQYIQYVQPQAEAPQQQQSQQQQLVQYVQAGEQQPQVEVRQEVHYVQRQPEQPDEQHNTHHHSSCNHREEYVAVSKGESVEQQQQQPKQDYPAEIVYVNQPAPNEASRAEGAETQANEYRKVATSLVQNSGLPATILAEVPLRDLSQDVLSKLRKDFGVKVVATREQPGANLMINCDEFSNNENSICSRPQPNHPVEHHVPYLTEPSHAEEHHEEHHHSHLPEPVAEHHSDSVEPVSHYEHNHELAHEHEHEHRHELEYEHGHEPEEPKQGTYITRNGETRVAGYINNNEQPEHGEHNLEENVKHHHHHHHHHHEDNEAAAKTAYGSRNAPSEHHEERAHENNDKPIEHNQEEKVHHQPESQANDSGFEAQPNVDPKSIH